MRACHGRTNGSSSCSRYDLLLAACCLLLAVLESSTCPSLPADSQLAEQAMWHVSSLLSNPLPPALALRQRGSKPMEDPDTGAARALLALAKKHKPSAAVKLTTMAANASCMVRRGRPRAALQLLRKASAALDKAGSKLECVNGWLNESAAFMGAGDYPGALGSAERAAGALHEVRLAACYLSLATCCLLLLGRQLVPTCSLIRKLLSRTSRSMRTRQQLMGSFSGR